MEEFQDWLSDHTWVAWIVVAGALLGAEMLSLDLVLAMLAVGAGAGAISSVLGAPFLVDVFVAVAVAVSMLVLVRPSVAKRLHAGPELVTGHQALVGRSAEVLAPVTETSGRVRLAGEDWSARSYDPSLTIEPGTRVEVYEIDGATAVVYPAG